MGYYSWTTKLLVSLLFLFLVISALRGGLRNYLFFLFFCFFCYNGSFFSSLTCLNFPLSFILTYNIVAINVKKKENFCFCLVSTRAGSLVGNLSLGSHLSSPQKSLCFCILQILASIVKCGR